MSPSVSVSSQVIFLPLTTTMSSLPQSMLGEDPTFAASALAAVLATLAPETVGPASAETEHPARMSKAAAAVAKRGRVSMLCLPADLVARTYRCGSPAVQD